jgi:hypothetical protein
VKECKGENHSRYFIFLFVFLVIIVWNVFV